MKRTPLKRTSSLSRSTPMPKGTTPMKKVNRERLDRRTKDYRDYIASPTWKAKRTLALEASNWTCARCGYTPIHAGRTVSVPDLIEGMGLEVHHKKGALRFGGDELPEDLEVLCQSCHRNEHATRFIRPRGLRRAG